MGNLKILFDLNKLRFRESNFYKKFSLPADLIVSSEPKNLLKEYFASNGKLFSKTGIVYSKNTFQFIG